MWYNASFCAIGKHNIDKFYVHRMFAQSICSYRNSVCEYYLIQWEILLSPLESRNLRK